MTQLPPEYIWHLERMEKIGRAMGIPDFRPTLHDDLEYAFSSLRTQPRHVVRSFLRDFYEGDEQSEDKQLQRPFHNGRHVAYAVERIMYMKLCSAKDFQNEGRISELLRRSITFLQKYFGAHFEDDFEYWPVMKRHMKVACLGPSIRLGRYDDMEPLWDHAEAAIEPVQTTLWGISGAITDLADYVAFEVLRDVRFRCRGKRFFDGTGVYKGYGEMASANGVNFAEPIAEICEMGFVVPELLVENGTVKAWIIGENIGKKLDIMPVPTQAAASAIQTA